MLRKIKATAETISLSLERKSNNSSGQQVMTHGSSNMLLCKENGAETCHHPENNMWKANSIYLARRKTEEINMTANDHLIKRSNL